MKKTNIKLMDVQTVYKGPEGDLWELIMGEQIHAGGMMSSMELAERAGIKEGMYGADLCCCNGAGMRFLVQNFKVTMCGVDAVQEVITRGKERNKRDGVEDKINFIEADVTKIPVDTGTFDFAWGEDAWCYVEDKDKLIKEAVRIIKPGGIVAFTDWIEGPGTLSDDEAMRFNSFMKFPYLESISGYKTLMKKNGLEVKEAMEIPFAKYIDLYITMITEQLTSDALRIMGNDGELLKAMGEEMKFMQQLAHDKKIARGRFIGTRKTD